MLEIGQADRSTNSLKQMEKPMPAITRRDLMRKSSFAASAALVAAGSAGVSAQESSGGNVFHVFAFQWKPTATDELKSKAGKDIRAFQGTIPGLLETHVGPNISPRGKGYTFGGIMRFKNQAALDAYVQRPLHKALLVWLVPLIDAIELDLPPERRRPKSRSDPTARKLR
jgi:hypothetical protein